MMTTQRKKRKNKNGVIVEYVYRDERDDYKDYNYDDYITVLW